jgi:hypothetical protein
LHTAGGENPIARGDQDSFRKRLCNHHPIKRVSLKTEQTWDRRVESLGFIGSPQPGTEQ